MAVVMSSSSARVVGRSRAVRRCAYVSVAWELDRGRRESSLSFFSCLAEIFGGFSCPGKCQDCSLNWSEAQC
jgi:hypothetical protein